MDIQNKVVLVVDDLLSITQAIKQSLEEESFRVLTAANGKQALDLCNGQTIDLIITDLIMPEMDGFELIKQVRQIQQYRTTPVLVLTSKISPGFKAQAKRAGATGWVAKPFISSKIIDTIHKMIGKT